MNSETIPIHNDKDFKEMRKAGSLAANILDKLQEIIKPGISTKYINNFCEKIIKDYNAIAAPKGYVVPTHKDPFPESICTSVNEVVCHGIPNEKKLVEGDIINVDVTVILDGWHGDSSRMYIAGKPKYSKVGLLLKTTYECLLKGIEVAKPGNHFGDIGYVIQKHAESKNFSVVKDYTGHGIGKKFHTPPQVLHYGKRGEREKIKPGMFFTIEPMLNMGKDGTKNLSEKDGSKAWPVVTADRKLSAQFEHTIGINQNGNEIFTLSQNNTDFPINTI